MNKILLFLLFSVSFAVQAQKNIQGIIKDNETGNPIEYAMIIGNVSGKTTVTNSEGRFQFNMPAEDSKIIIKHLDYFTKELAVNNNKTFSVQLQPSSESLEEIVILKTSIQKEIEKVIKTSRANFAKDLKLNTYYRELAYINGTMYQYEDAEMDYYLKSINKSNVIVRESRSVKFTNDEAKKFDSLTNVHYYWGDLRNYVSDEFDFTQLKEIISNKEYEMYLTTKTGGDGTELNVLNFYPAENAKKATLAGTMVYGAKDNLIREIKINLAPQALDKSEFLPNNNGHWRKRSFYNMTTIYKLYNGKYSLAYISGRMYGTSEVLNQLTELGAFAELLVDSVTENPAKPNPDDFCVYYKLTPLGKNYKTKYWEKFNVVPLIYKEEQMLKAINR